MDWVLRSVGNLQRLAMSLVHAPVGHGRVPSSSEQKEYALMMRCGSRTLHTPVNKVEVRQYGSSQLPSGGRGPTEMTTIGP